MLVGYLDRRDEEGAFDEDGFFRMGDLGQIVDDGYVVVTGRLKDIIIRNGENISPKEVEDILIAHPSVAEIAIVGLPHERTGEIACAFVVPVPGERLALPELIELLAERGTARFKYPERLELCEELPRNAAGKVLKHRLRDALVARQETP
jgi:non-ribosomal peptide synthetase component E (peptide arylation enzyme)